MNIALPILLLIFGGLSFWILAESTVRWYIKTACISIFCLFTVIFWTSIHTFLGWPADEADIPEKILIHWVVIKEPNKLSGYEGDIYILLESIEEIKANKIAKFFGYSKEKGQPRLFGVEYSRKLHEQMEKVKEKTKNGQQVTGKLEKGEEGSKIKGEKKGKADKKGEGSESQEQGWEFHELRPSDIQGKPNE